MKSNKSTAVNDGVGYSVIFENHSTNPGAACIYQKDPDLSVQNVLSLAWFSKFSYPESTEVFKWTIDYSFVWSETGELVPGVTFTASQNRPADLTTTNQITLDYDQANRAYFFTNQGAGSKSDSLYILESPAIPLKQAAVGIGMSGAGTFVVQSQPNQQLMFTPHPQYWIVFGDYHPGKVLDIENITGSARIDFDPGVSSMTATLNPDNTWSIGSTKQHNAQIVKARSEERAPVSVR